jgi:hypothetical protein
MSSSHVLVAYRESRLIWQLAGLDMWYATDFGIICFDTFCLKFQHPWELYVFFFFFDFLKFHR